MFKSVLDEHIEVVTALRNMESEVTEAAQKIGDSLQQGGKLLLMGNGGSAADAQHIAAELVVRYQKARRALPAIALTTDSSILTATGNDFDFNQIFSRQIEALARPGDVVVGISTSGESVNVIKALRAAKEQGVATIGLTGEIGGGVGEISDQTISVPSTITARVQEAHILIAHFWCEKIEEQW